MKLDHIHLGDCRELLAELPDESVDLVVTSPPYNLGKEYESKKALEVYIAEKTEVLEECVRVLKQSGSIFWQVGSFSEDGMLIPLDVRFFPVLESLGMIPRNRIAWIRSHGVHARNKFSARYETVLWFTKSDDYKFNLDPVRVPQKYRNKKHHKGEKKGELSCNPDGKNPSDIWAFRNVKHNHEEQTIHPCQFPEDMVARMMLSTTEERDVVLDPYMGAGTVAVVARDYDRHYLGAETEEKYHEVAIRRLDGTPDKNNCFPNLKTLRDYVERTGEPIERFSFDRQTGEKPTPRSKAKIHSEQHHLEEKVKRLLFETEHFSAMRKGEEPPEDYFQKGRVRKNKTEKSKREPSLFDQNGES